MHLQATKFIKLSPALQATLLLALSLLWHCLWIYVFYLQEKWKSYLETIHPLNLCFLLLLPFVIYHLACLFLIRERPFRKEHPFLSWGTTVFALSPAILLVY